VCVHVAERSPLGHLLLDWEGSRVVLEVLGQQLAVETLRVQRVVVARSLGWLVVSLPSSTPSSGSETVKTKGTAVGSKSKSKSQSPPPRKAGEPSPNAHRHNSTQWRPQEEERAGSLGCEENAEAGMTYRHRGRE